MEYSISLQALFTFEIGIQALIQFVVLFDIQSCLVSRAYLFCLSNLPKSIDLLDKIFSTRTFHPLLRTCFDISAPWQQRMRLKASFIPKNGIRGKRTV